MVDVDFKETLHCGCIVNAMDNLCLMLNVDTEGKELISERPKT
jgi:hypothetical protein